MKKEEYNNYKNRMDYYNWQVKNKKIEGVIFEDVQEFKNWTYKKTKIKSIEEHGDWGIVGFSTYMSFGKFKRWQRRNWKVLRGEVFGYVK